MNALTVVLLVLVLLLLVGALPLAHPYHGFGYYPGGLGLVLLIVLLVLVLR